MKSHRCCLFWQCLLLVEFLCSRRPRNKWLHNCKQHWRLLDGLIFKDVAFLVITETWGGMAFPTAASSLTSAPHHDLPRHLHQPCPKTSSTHLHRAFMWEIFSLYFVVLPQVYIIYVEKCLLLTSCFVSSLRTRGMLSFPHFTSSAQTPPTQSLSSEAWQVLSNWVNALFHLSNGVYNIHVNSN